MALRWAVCATTIAFSISTIAFGQDLLAMFDGVWISVNPPGYRIAFNKIGGGLRQANLPVLGATTVTVSDGRDASNLKVSGAGFDCYFLFAATANNEMTWTLQSGPSTCPPTAVFKKEQIATPAPPPPPPPPKQYEAPIRSAFSEYFPLGSSSASLIDRISTPNSSRDVAFVDFPSVFRFQAKRHFTPVYVSGSPVQRILLSDNNNKLIGVQYFESTLGRIRNVASSYSNGPPHYVITCNWDLSALSTAFDKIVTRGNEHPTGSRDEPGAYFVQQQDGALLALIWKSDLNSGKCYTSALYVLDGYH